MKAEKTNPAVPLLMVPFSEVRHFQPEDSLYVEPIDVRGQQYEWTIPAHRHDGLHQFQLLTRGSALVMLDGEQFSMLAPAALMVAPGVVHGFVYEPGSVGQQVTLPTHSLQAALGSASNLVLRLRVSIRVTQDGNGGDFDECAALFDLLVREFGNSRPGRAEALNAHAVLLALWFLRHDANTGPGQQQPAVRDTLVQRFRLLLEQNYRDARPVHFYAEALGITSDHLSRTCRASTGSGALDLMRDRVVLEARRLLAYTPETIAGIARELGFEDPGHFSRFFANAVGQPPSIYRRAVFSGFAGAPAVSKSH